MNSYNSFKIFVAETLSESGVIDIITQYKNQWEQCQNDHIALNDLKTKIIQELSGTAVATEDILTFALSQGVSLEMIRVKAGSFMMGSPENEDGRSGNEKLHKVTLTQDYWLGKFSVTQAQWNAVMKGVRASQDNEDLSDPSYFTGGNRPVEQVSWNDVKDFCNKLNERYAGKLPVINGVRYQFDLPTEAQWEYACRAGRKTAYFWGKSCNGTEANCNGNYPCGTGAKGPYLGQTSTAGQYQPNPCFFYDMHGNVWEWCRDWYNDDYGEDAIDPVGPSSGSNRVFRGGSWSNGARQCRSAFRGAYTPGFRNRVLGFRLGLVKL